MINLNNYKYYKGEDSNPFERKDEGKAFWWYAECNAALNGDKKERERLSKSMQEFIREKHWDGSVQHDTPWEAAIQRATELYRMGIWSQNYISFKKVTLEQAIDTSVY